MRNLARRLDQEAPGVAASIQGLDEMLTVTRLRLPMPLRRSLACTNAIEDMMGTVGRSLIRWLRLAAACEQRQSTGTKFRYPQTVKGNGGVLDRY
jgi:putative transposase